MIQMAWVTPDNKTIVSRRASTTQAQPEPDRTTQSIIELVSSESGIINNQFVATFRRPKAQVPIIRGVQAEIDQTGRGQPMIWAIGLGQAGSTFDAELTYHSGGSGSVPTVNLFAPASAFQAGVSDVPFPRRQPGGDNSATGGTGQAADNTAFSDGGSVSQETRDYYIQIHGAVMFIAWCGFAPVAILAARYLKTYMGIWWFRSHLAFMFLGVLGGTIAGFVLVFLSVKTKHFDPTKYGGLGSHLVIGLAICILTILNILLGFIIDRLWKPTRRSIPWYDKLHWWLGRVTVLLAWVNVPLGLVLYDVSLFKEIHFGWYAAFGAWTAYVVALFVVFEVKYGPSRHVEADSSGSDKMGGFGSKSV
ncbi:hypothetical protein HK102_001719 [Quaeritorhiza haematococci]|nr:hypothetical protein HK102_001719 [Quaeritorhiza haematococci]